MVVNLISDKIDLAISYTVTAKIDNELIATDTETGTITVDASEDSYLSFNVHRNKNYGRGRVGREGEVAPGIFLITPTNAYPP